jgi:hypothetical protein
VWRDATDGEPKAYLQQMLRDREGFVKLLNILVGEEIARQLRERESLPNALTDHSRLQLLWVFGLDGEARARAEELLLGEVSGANRHLIEWFVMAHESANRPIENEWGSAPAWSCLIHRSSYRSASSRAFAAFSCMTGSSCE